MTGLGIPPVYGDNPRGKIATETGSSNIFAPQHFSVVYMKFDSANGAPRLIARHAYFDGGAPDAATLECAVDFLRKGDADASPSACRPLPFQPGPTAPANCEAATIFDDFKCFGFGAQIRIYALVDNDDVAFYQKVPLSFTAFSADADFGEVLEPPADPNDPKLKDPNKSFYGATLMPDLVGGRRLLYVENHFRDNEGNPIKQNSEMLSYSINFNLRICRVAFPKCDLQNDDQTIPTVIDPGSGNGLGYPP